MLILKKFRLTIFDVFFALLLVCVASAFLFLRISKKTEQITVRIVIANNDWIYEGAPPQWWYGDSLAPGLKAYNSFGSKIAEVTNVTNFDIGAYRRRIYVDIKLQGSFDSKRQVYLYNYQPIQIGKSLDLTFGKQNIRGIITYINNLPNYTSRTIDVRLPAVRPWVANSYERGLTMVDSQSKPLAEVLSVEFHPSTVKEVVDIGQFSQKKYSGSDFIDIIMRIKILTFKSNGVDYFVDRAAIKVGELISFQFPKTVAREAEIIAIVE